MDERTTIQLAELNKTLAAQKIAQHLNLAEQFRRFAAAARESNEPIGTNPTEDNAFLRYHNAKSTEENV